MTMPADYIIAMAGSLSVGRRASTRRILNWRFA